MLRIMLVDDNRVALEYFSSLVNWGELGYELVCTAIDGESALILFRKYHPEVVITDVQMPNMDGINLTREVMRIAPDTVMIFLSSYEEFSYIRSAMQLGVSDYILKHETKAPQMTEKLLTIKKILENKKRERKYVAEGYFQKLLQDKYLESDHSENREIHLSYFQGKYDLTIVFQSTVFHVMGEYFDWSTIGLEVDEVRRTLYIDPSVVLVIGVTPYIYVIVSEHAEDPIAENYHRKELLEDNFSTSFTFMLLCEDAVMESCVKLYLKRCSLFGQVFFFPPSSVLQSSAFRMVTDKEEEFTGKDLEKLLSEESQYSLMRALDQFFLKTIREQNLAGYEGLVRICVETLLAFEGKVIDYEKGSVFQVYNASAEKSWMDALSLFYWLKERLSYLAMLRKENRGKSYSSIVRDVLLYIYSHYGDSELTAEVIAEKLKIGINQLNVVVKKETGCTVWRLLIQVRMEIAKKLLDTTNQKIIDISRQVGYSTIAYFSTAFRKYYHISPQEYRRGLDE